MKETRDGHTLSPEEHGLVGQLVETLLEVMPPEQAKLTVRRMVSWLPSDPYRRQRVGEEVCAALDAYREEAADAVRRIVASTKA